MIVGVGGKSIQLDDEGYLIEPNDWDEDVTAYLAEQEGIELTDEHWQVIQFMRKYYENHVIAVDARFVIKFLAEQRVHRMRNGDANGFSRKADL